MPILKRLLPGWFEMNTCSLKTEFWKWHHSPESFERSSHDNKVLTVSETPPNSSQDYRIHRCHRLEATVKGNNNEVKKITCLQRWEMWCFLRSPAFIPFIGIRCTIKKHRPQQNRLQYFEVYVDRLQKRYYWFNICGSSKVMISINIIKPAILLLKYKGAIHLLSLNLRQVMINWKNI